MLTDISTKNLMGVILGIMTAMAMLFIVPASASNNGTNPHDPSDCGIPGTHDFPAEVTAQVNDGHVDFTVPQGACTIELTFTIYEEGDDDVNDRNYDQQTVFTTITDSYIPGRYGLDLGLPSCGEWQADFYYGPLRAELQNNVGHDDVLTKGSPWDTGDAGECQPEPTPTPTETETSSPLPTPTPTPTPTPSETETSSPLPTPTPTSTPTTIPTPTSTPTTIPTPTPTPTTIPTPSASSSSDLSLPPSEGMPTVSQPESMHSSAQLLSTDTELAYTGLNALTLLRYSLFFLIVGAVIVGLTWKPKHRKDER